MIEMTKEIQERTDFICSVIVAEKRKHELQKINGNLKEILMLSL